LTNERSFISSDKEGLQQIAIDRGAFARRGAPANLMTSFGIPAPQVNRP
jgi:hypothetical protein